MCLEYIHKYWPIYGFNNGDDTLTNLIIQYIVPYRGNVVTIQNIRNELRRANLNHSDRIKLNNLFASDLERIKGLIDKESRKFATSGILPVGSDLRRTLSETINHHLRHRSNSYKVLVLITDIYMLYRLFKNFDIKNRGPTLCRNDDKQNRIIVYAGNDHIKNYKYVLERLFPNSLKFSINFSENKKVDFARLSSNIGNFRNFDEIAQRFCE